MAANQTYNLKASLFDELGNWAFKYKYLLLFFIITLLFILVN